MYNTLLFNKVHQDQNMNLRMPMTTLVPGRFLLFQSTGDPSAIFYKFIYTWITKSPIGGIFLWMQFHFSGTSSEKLQIVSSPRLPNSINLLIYVYLFSIAAEKLLLHPSVIRSRS